MRCLSLHQPYASLIAAGIKLHETRSWRAPASIIGKRIAIHAAKSTRCFQLLATDTMLSILVARVTRGCPWLLPFGCIVATAIVRDCQRTQDIPSTIVSADDYASGDWTPDRFAWGLADIRPVNTPMPVTGRQGVFHLPGNVVLALGKLGAA